MNFPQTANFYVSQLCENEWYISFSDNSMLYWAVDENIEIKAVSFWGTGSAAQANNHYVGFIPVIPIGFTITPFQYTTVTGSAFGYFDHHNCNLKLDSGVTIVLYNNNTGFGKLHLHVKRIASGTSNEVIKKCDLINWILGRCD